MFRIRLLPAVLLLVLPLLACTIASGTPPQLPTAALQATVDTSVLSEVALERFESAELGLTFEYPEGWTYESFPGYISLASDPALLELTSTTPAEGAVMLVASGPAERFPDDSVEAALTSAVEELNLAGDVEIVEGPTETTIDGNEAIILLLQGTEETTNEDVVFYVAFIRDAARAAVVSGTTRAVTADQFRPLFEAVAESVRLDTLAGAERPVAESAGAIEVGQTVTGTLAANSAIYWRFSGEAGDAVDIIAEPTGDTLDLAATVVDASGRSLVAGGGVDANIGTEQIQGLALPADGEYRIVLWGFLGSGGDYRLTLESSAVAVGGLVPGSIVTSTLSAGETDAYPLTARGGISMTLTVVPSRELDVILEVLDLDENVLLNVDAGFDGEGEFAVFSPLQDGEYTVRVREFSGEGSGTYALNATSLNLARLDVQDTVAAGASNDHSLVLAGGESIIVTAIPEGDFDLVVELYDASNQVLQEVDAGFESAPELFAFTAPEAGDYSVRIAGFEGTGGQYRLLVSGQSSAGANSDAPGSVEASSVQRQLEAGGVFETSLAPEATDDYTFEGRQGEEIVLYVLPLGSMDPVLTIQGESATPLTTVDDGFTGEGEVIVFVPETSGNFTLQVTDFIGNGGPYAVGILDREEALLNETGRVENDAVVAYPLTLNEGEVQVIMVFPEEAFDASVEVLDGNGRPVAQSDVGVAGQPEILLFRPDHGGNFTIRIRGFVNVGGSYTLTVLGL